tara:strand:+ start:470 stop:751 length:282 start_codon:yes stop_codon:yes gene_type:complete
MHSNLKEWFQKRKITNYSQLLENINTDDVIPPEEHVVAEYFAQSSPVNSSKSQNGMAVDGEGFLVAEQIKKEKKPVKRKRNTKTSRKTSAKSQ